jgi:hypothetical protein
MLVIENNSRTIVVDHVIAAISYRITNYSFFPQVPSKLKRLCAPSQNGLLALCPQRHRKIGNLSTSIVSPVSPSTNVTGSVTFNGPFFDIFTILSAMVSFHHSQFHVRLGCALKQVKIPRSPGVAQRIVAQPQRHQSAATNVCLVAFG